MIALKRRSLHVLSCAVVVGVLQFAAFADELAVQGQAELRKAVESFRPGPSLDTRPVEFSITGIHYRVPRNYLRTMQNWSRGPQYIVGLRVTFLI
jgi:hypothetical protein